MDEFTEVYDTRTGLKQRVPAAWLGDPVLGRFIVKTPSQRALDGELGQAPTDESTVKDIRAFAAEADIDVTGLTKKDDLLAAVRAVVGTDPLPEPAADQGVAVEAAVVGGDVETPAGETPAGDAPPATSTTPAAAPADGNSPTPTETPAAGA